VPPPSLALGKDINGGSVVPTGGVKSLLRLVYMLRNSRTGIDDVVLNLCSNAESRKRVLSLLLDVLVHVPPAGNDSSTEDDGDASWPPMRVLGSGRESAVMPAVTSVATRHRMAGDQSASAEYVVPPPAVSQRVLELIALLRRNTHVHRVMLEPEPLDDTATGGSRAAASFSRSAFIGTVVAREANEKRKSGAGDAAAAAAAVVTQSQAHPSTRGGAMMSDVMEGSSDPLEAARNRVPLETLLSLLSLPEYNLSAVHLSMIVELLAAIVGPMEQLRPPRATTTTPVESPAKPSSDGAATTGGDEQKAADAGADAQTVTTATTEGANASASAAAGDAGETTTAAVALKSKKAKAKTPDDERYLVPARIVAPAQLHSLARVLLMDRCSEATFKTATKVVNALAMVQENRNVLLRALLMTAEGLGGRAVRGLDELMGLLRHATSLSLGQQSNLFLPSDTEGKLLRILKTVNVLAGTPDALRRLCQFVQLDSLWNALSKCVQMVVETGGGGSEEGASERAAAAAAIGSGMGFLRQEDRDAMAASASSQARERAASTISMSVAGSPAPSAMALAIQESDMEEEEEEIDDSEVESDSGMERDEDDDDDSDGDGDEDENMTTNSLPANSGDGAQVAAAAGVGHPRPKDTALTTSLSRFLPLIEAFFILNGMSSSTSTEEDDSPAVTSGSSSSSVSGEETAAAAAVAKPADAAAAATVSADTAANVKRTAEDPTGRLLTFVQEHQLALNMLVRQTPALLESSLECLVKHPKCRHVLAFDNKRHFFRTAMKRVRAEVRRGMYGSMRLSVRRDHVFEDSFHQLMLRNADELRGRLSIAFHGEEGIDAGGVTREWYSILAREIFKPDYALFKPSADSSAFQPDPRSKIVENHLSYFKFVGRVVGKAVADGHLLDAHFTRSFYKHILGIAVTYHDIQSVDPQYYNSLMQMLQYNIEDLGLELDFTIETEEFGVIKSVELKPDGAQIPVTEANKLEFVKLATKHKMTTGIRKQIDSFLEGFNELVPKRLIRIFNEHELELLVSGVPSIDLDDLKENTEYVSYSLASPQVRWFWTTIEALDREDHARFLMFVTGTSKVPLEGFKALVGMRGLQKFSIHKAYGGDKTLPSAHTCFNQLDLPEYSTEEILREKLLYAIKEGGEGFGFG
jgi:hypothetical protein